VCIPKFEGESQPPEIPGYTQARYLENQENPPPWPPRPAELARWPLEWRAKWGLLANELESQGLKFPECERRAFDIIKAEMEAMP
jgi:hypothetical protein